MQRRQVQDSRHRLTGLLFLALGFLQPNLGQARSFLAELAAAPSGQPEPQLSSLRPVSQLNLTSPVEPASAHEPRRFYLSSGAGLLRWAGEQVARQHFALTTGLYYPLDISVSFAQLQTPSPKEPFQLASYLQWTLYEDFALPALAVRLQWARLYNLEAVNLQTFSPSLQMSWGFQSLTLFAGLAGHWHEGAIKPTLMRPEERGARFHSWEQSHTWGLQWQLVPGFLALAAEVLQNRASKLYQGQARIEF